MVLAPAFCFILASLEGKIWSQAISYCRSCTLGNRKGWRLPPVEELSSLVDPSQSDPALSSGHLLINVEGAEASSTKGMAVVTESLKVLRQFSTLPNKFILSFLLDSLLYHSSCNLYGRSCIRSITVCFCISGKLRSHRSSPDEDLTAFVHTRPS